MMQAWLGKLGRWLRKPAPEATANITPPAAAAHRPKGALIWVHDPTGLHSREIDALIEHLEDIQDAPVLIWSGPVDAAPDLAHSIVPAPPDTTTAAKAFLDHWTPDLALFFPPTLPGALTAELHRRALPCFLYQADAHYKPPRNQMRRFTRYLAADQAVAGGLARHGAPGERISVIGALFDGTAPPPADEATRNQMAQLLAARPSWLAAACTASEDQIIVAAHAQAARRAHRLLLILNPDTPERSADLAARLRREKWRVAQRSAGESPDEETQILIADTPDELGLWFRIAPVSLMGGSLDPHSPGGIDPMGAAALGSAILHGPNLGTHASTYARLNAAGAARTLRDAQGLARLLNVFGAPEKAAEMAHNAWQVSTVGAQATGLLADMILEELRKQESR